MTKIRTGDKNNEMIWKSDIVSYGAYMYSKTLSRTKPLMTLENRLKLNHSVPSEQIVYIGFRIINMRY